MIPKTPETGCKKGTLDYKYTYTDGSGRTIEVGATCMCEEHCAWDRCHLVKPPGNCLDGTKGVWKWDEDNGYWVAQETISGCNK